MLDPVSAWELPASPLHSAWLGAPRCSSKGNCAETLLTGAVPGEQSPMLPAGRQVLGSRALTLAGWGVGVGRKGPERGRGWTGSPWQPCVFCRPQSCWGGRNAQHHCPLALLRGGTFPGSCGPSLGAEVNQSLLCTGPPRPVGPTLVLSPDGRNPREQKPHRGRAPPRGSTPQQAGR